MKRVALCLLVGVSLLLFGQGAGAETRVAMVIGNSNYPDGRALANPVRDALGVAAALRQAGFTDVDIEEDLDEASLQRALARFGEKADGADVAIIYYAGHGMEIGGLNYLIPVDFKPTTDRAVPLEATSLEMAQQAVGGARRLGLVILDACRDNPFASALRVTGGGRRSMSRGLAPPTEPSGNTMIVFAARDGTSAQDGAGEHGPFAAALIRRLPQPGVEVDKLFRQVRDDVLRATNNEQQPWVYGSIGGDDFYFLPPLSSGHSASPSDSRAVDLAFWDSIRNSSNPADFQAYLTKFPSGEFSAIARNRLAPPAGPPASFATPAPERTGGPVASSPPRAGPTIVTHPDWIRKPNSDDIQRYYPERAIRMNVGGSATLDCEVDVSGSLDGCRVTSEDPGDMGFGDAAMQMSRLFKMSPQTVNGRPVGGARVRIPIRFSVPQG